MNVVLLGDVGGAGGYHVGDEAMLDAAVEHLRRRGEVDITVISADPADTAERYSVRSIPSIGFDGSGAETGGGRDRRLAAVRALSSRGARGRRSAERELEATGAAAASRAVIETIAASDALIVTGGGNLSSTWPEHLYERVAALSIASEHGVPSAVTSQTVGPDLSARERALLAEAFGEVRLVGVRERDSLHLVSSVLAASTPRRLQLDDAVDLPAAEVASFDGYDRLADGFVAVTINPLGTGPRAEAHLDGLASLVRGVHQRTGLRVAFLPHVGSWRGGASGDTVVGEALHERLGHGAEFIVCPLLPARQLAALTRRAAAIVSTRYHPIVFGLSAAVPCLAIYQDRYTLAKLKGALSHAGVGEWRVPLDAVLTDLPADAFDELWSRRKAITDHLSAVSAGWVRMQSKHWDEVWFAVNEPVRALAAEGDSLRPEPSALQPKVAGLAAINIISAEHLSLTATRESQWRALSTEAELARLDAKSVRTARAVEVEGLRAELGRSERDRQAAAAALAVALVREPALQADLALVDMRRAAVEADNIQLLDEIGQAEGAAAAARALVAQLRQHFDAVIGQLATAQAELAGAERKVDDLEAQIACLHATRTMRWTRLPRRLVRRLKRHQIR